MKKIASLSVLFCLILAFTSCSSDDEGTTPPPQEPGLTAAAIEGVATTGTWSVSSFMNSGEDRTGDFTGFSFEFQESGVLRAVNGDVVILGSWSVEADDSTTLGFKVNIEFSIPDEFRELTEDWNLAEITNTRMDLTDGMDSLTFTRN
ncbi:hypothetical protein [Croceiramulus getboli]|nr:hypothetical protein P8624_03800 [Flavobacteriaceae bacterium YJPT1-3]